MSTKSLRSIASSMVIFGKGAKTKTMNGSTSKTSGMFKAGTRILYLLIILVLGVMEFPERTDANGLPWSSLLTHPVGGALGPDAQTPVAVVREDLFLDLRGPVAHIRAHYRLRNLSSSGITVTVAFPIPQHDGVPAYEGIQPQVWVDDRSEETALAAPPPTLDNDVMFLQKEWLDPYTGEAYLPTEWRRRPVPDFFIFQVPFEAHQERSLLVEYNQYPSLDYARFARPSRRIDYLLQPARYWADFGELTIEVLAPFGRPVRSSLPLTPNGYGRYTGTFSGLPEGNLSIFLAPGVGPSWSLSSLWWQRSTRPWFILAIAFLGGAASGCLSWSIRRSRQRLAITTSWMTLVTTALLTSSLVFPPDSIGILRTWFIFFPGVLLVYSLGRWLPRNLLQNCTRRG